MDGTPPCCGPNASRRLRGLAVVAFAGAVMAVASCGGDDEEPAPAPPPADTSDPKTERGPGVGDGRGEVELAEIGTFEQPLYLTQPPEGDDALYVVEQAGRVMRVPPGGGRPEVFLDLSGEVSCCGEQGLLSIAFAPDHAESGGVYASFTNSAGDSRVVEYRAENNRVDPASGREILAQEQPFGNHNGGLLLFDPDGDLLLGLGDGGGAGDPNRNAQDTSTLLGKLIRLDTSGEGNHEIVAIGLRNPWRFSFDRETDDLWIGDVGQDAFEEINGVAPRDIRDANFGWSAFEGYEPFNDDQDAPGHVRPVHVYAREGGNCSVTGGHVVRDERLESLYGRYLYGDYCLGALRSFTAVPGKEAADDRPLGPEVSGLSSFGEDREGRIYATSLEGPVYRLEPAGG